MSNPDVRWIQRFDNFKRAFARLSDATVLAKQRGLLSRFALTPQDAHALSPALSLHSVT